jgi:hypothetical protein
MTAVPAHLAARGPALVPPPTNTSASPSFQASAAASTDLGLLTNVAAAQALLQSNLPGFSEGRLRIESLVVRGARRNTSQEHNPRPMTLCYELLCRDTARQCTGTQLLYVEVFRHAADARAAVALQDTRQLVTPAFGEPLVHLPAWNLVVWALPNDPGLPQLATLLDAACVASRLPGPSRVQGGLPAHPGSHGHAGWADPVRVELLRYEPRQRATLRYTANSPDGGGPHTVYAKTFRDDRATTIDARFRYFWSMAQNDPAAPCVAQPLGFDAATRTVWQAPAVGVPLRDALALADGDAVLGRVAHALARLHAAPLAPTAAAEPRSVNHWLAEVRRRHQKIARIDATLEPRVARIVAAIEAQAERQAQRPLSLIHGDFHPDQVWVQDGRVLLFDFDEFTFGDPMEDVAEFVLKLEQQGTAPELVATFIDRCATADAAHFDRASLAWHLVIQSLLQASRAFVYQRPGWAQALGQRLAACESRVAELNLATTA